MNYQNKVVVITGAGSGIGRQLTLQLVAKGARVAAADLNPDSLRETAALLPEQQDQISTHVLNITDQEAVEALPHQVIETHGQVDCLFNNAGIIQPFLKLHQLDMASIRKVVDVDFWGTLYMTKSFLPHLLNRPEAQIINVSSMAGFFPFPGQTIYGASKAAVKIMTEGLYAELSETNVTVSVVFPGAVETNILNNSEIDASNMGDNNGEYKSLSAEEAARQIIQGGEKERLKILVGNDAKFMDKFYRISPRRAIQYINKQMKGLFQ